MNDLSVKGRIHSIQTLGTVDGPGVRFVVFTQGCNLRCGCCHNPETWNPNAGQLFDEAAKQELFQALSKPYIKGVTLSGGDPLYCDNIAEMTILCKEIKEKMPEKDIWCYTGFIFENIRDLEIMDYIDVLVDGKFEKERKNIQLLFRGSENQRLILVEPSKRLNTIVLYQQDKTERG